jgi:vancomycin resistance protein YoaR
MGAWTTVTVADKTYEVTDETLRIGWWNEQDQITYRQTKGDYADVKALVQRIRKDVEVKPYDGEVVFNPSATSHDERFTVSGQKDGIDLDEEKLYRDIVKSMKSGDNKNIVASSKPIKPKPESEIVSKLGLRAGYTTYFEHNPSRERNIELAMQSLNGLAIEKGQTVSFNKIVGKRTKERGYQEAKIIKDGEFVPGIGGGVCQASTTLFNAVLLAGLTVDKSAYG